MDDETVGFWVEQAGSLLLGVWVDGVADGRVRFGYRIAESTSRRVLVGRDLSSGVGQRADARAGMRSLAGFLMAAGEAYAHGQRYPGLVSENADLFPQWVCRCAASNLDELALLSVEPDPDADAGADSGGGVRWLSVVLLQGQDADPVLELIEADGVDAAVAHLQGWDFGDETQQAALADGHVYNKPPVGIHDRAFITGRYALTYSHATRQVALLRQWQPKPQDALPNEPEPQAFDGQYRWGKREFTATQSGRASSFGPGGPSNASSRPVEPGGVWLRCGQPDHGLGIGLGSGRGLAP